MKTIFHLISGREVALSEDSKIISGRDFSQLMEAEGILSELQQDKEQLEAEKKEWEKECRREKKQAQKALKKQQEQAKEQEAEYRREVAKECEKIKEKATEEGFDEGLKKWMEAISAQEKAQQEAGEQWKEVIGSLALKAAKKIVGDQLKEDPAVIVSIVKQHLKSVAQCSKIVVYVHPKALKQVEKNRPSIKALFEKIDTLSFLAREDIDEGGAIIETEIGVIDARLEKMWSAMEAVFSQFVPSVHEKKNKQIKAEASTEEEEREENDE